MSRLFPIVTGILLLVGFNAIANIDLPETVDPSGCRVGGVYSTEQWTSTGFSNVRTANPSDNIVAGAWVVANNSVPDTSIIVPPNCSFLAGAPFDDGLGINLIAVRLMPTIGSAADADIREIQLWWDVNVNGLWDPLLDLLIQAKPGRLLDNQDGVLFYYGPQSPLAFLSNTGPTPPLECEVGAGDFSPSIGLGPSNGLNSRNAPGGNDGCYIALLAIAVIGDNPNTGTQFGLDLYAHAADIPGTTGISSATFSSNFSLSRNPQASNVRLHMVGGDPSSYTFLEHISNSSGGPESAARAITFTGGQQGEGLLSRFRALEIIPGTREAIAMVVAVCDGGELANAVASILPAIAGAPPTIAGGLASLPCIPSAGTDGFATGINGATLIFRGPLARYMSTVRMYADECTSTGSTANKCLRFDSGPPFPTTASRAGGGDGFLFQAGELVEQMVPVYNEETNEAIVQFGFRQEQILFTGNGSPVAAGSDPCSVVVGGCGGGFPAVAVPQAGTAPLLLIWTVDIDSNAPGGLVDVILGLQSFDDTAINAASAGGNPCVVFALSASATPLAPNFVGAPAVPGACASNFLNIGPEIYSFSVSAPESPSTPNNLAAFDTNKSCFLDDPEFFSMIDLWVDGQIGDNLFFAGVDAWVGQTHICSAAAAASVGALSLNNISLDAGFNSTTFSVMGQGIEQIGVEIFSLDGEVIFSGQNGGTSLNWNTLNNNGAPVANGTYLYTVTVQGAGSEITSEVQKLVVVR